MNLKLKLETIKPEYQINLLEDIISDARMRKFKYCRNYSAKYDKIIDEAEKKLKKLT